MDKNELSGAQNREDITVVNKNCFNQKEIAFNHFYAIVLN